MKIEYAKINIRHSGLTLINHVNTIIAEYKAAGYSLTLRQVYYQLVSRDLIENSEKSYKHIGNLVNNGRLAGLIDWQAIEDRTRTLRRLPHWETPAEIVKSAANQYRRDLWEGQSRYCEVWVEKDALIGIVEQAAENLDCPCFSCRGYTSQSEMWSAAMRFIDKADNGRDCVLIHLGDHDPSGIDMTRDIKERLAMFGASVTVKRIALNMSQIEEYNPPPNPAKETDTRAGGYITRYGNSSWELDALEPRTLDFLITTTIKSNLDQKKYNHTIKKQEAERKAITALLPLLNEEPPDNTPEESKSRRRSK